MFRTYVKVQGGEADTHRINPTVRVDALAKIIQQSLKLFPFVIGSVPYQSTFVLVLPQATLGDICAVLCDEPR